jgi:hypothetical protein
MISTVSLSFDLTYTNPVTGALQPRGIVTDSTNYSGPGGLGIDLPTQLAKGLGQITFNGDIIEDYNLVGTPMIDLEIWDYVTQGVPTFIFNLPLDVNGNLANGVYTLLYRLRLVESFEIPVDSATVNTIVITGYEYLANFLEAGNDVSNGAETVQVVSIDFVDPTLTINTTTIANPPAWEFLIFDVTNIQANNVYTYSGCVQSTAAVTFSYDCEVGTNGTWAVANSTVLNGQTITSLNATINYPAWTSLTPTFNSQIVTNTLPYSNNVLATGTFSVSLSQVIQNLQVDGLILQYVSSSVQEFVVSCAGSLCGLIPCIESLRNAHATELQRNRISKYQVFVDNLLIYYTQAQNYRSCGDIENYRRTLALIEGQIDASGCECGCCDPDTYQWVNNNAASTIDTLINAIQFRLVDGVPTINDDSADGVEVGALWEDVSGLPGTLGILYVCVDNSPGAAIWQVYYDPNEAPPGYDATDITYAGAALFPGPTNVATALDDTSTLITSQALSISSLFTALGVTNAAVASKLTANAPIVGAQRTKITYDTNGLVVAGTTLSATDIPSGVLATKIGAGLVDNTEFGYLNGVTSNLQTQLNTKLPSSLTADTILDYNNFKLTLANGTNQTDITKNQGTTSSVPALTVQARNAAAAAGFGSSIALSGNTTGNSTQVNMSTVKAYWTDASNGDSNFTVSTTKGEAESVKLTISNGGQITFNEYNLGNFPDPAPVYSLGVDASGNVVQTTPVSSGPLVYIGKVTGNGVGASITQIFNNTGATITFGQFVTGEYLLIASSAVFTSSKTGVFMTPVVGPAFVDVGYLATNQINVNTYNASGVAADLVANMVIKIEIYP